MNFLMDGEVDHRERTKSRSRVTPHTLPTYKMAASSAYVQTFVFDYYGFKSTLKISVSKLAKCHVSNLL